MPYEDKNPRTVKSQLNELPINFLGRGEVRGFKFTQLFKNDCGYLYQVEQSEGLIHFEVIKRVENQRFNRVSYPGSKSWGIAGWTFKTLDEAMTRFNQLKTYPNESD